MWRRGGPSKSTSANVQCQKCLKRDMYLPSIKILTVLYLTTAARHYSYECKASAQERPYIPRPSRTQQLFNPKLQPKLTNAVPDDIEKKEGIADKILAEKEAERAKKRELERDREDEPSVKGSPPPRRRRSPSYDSVSSISTRSPSPAPRRSPSPPRRERVSRDRELSPRGPPVRPRSLSPEEGYSREPSAIPERDYPPRRRSPSPNRRARSPRRHRNFDDEQEAERGPRHAPHGRDVEHGSHRHRGYSRSRSRSPARSPPRRDGRGRGDGPKNRYRERQEDHPRERNAPPVQQQAPPPPPPRERSLSPFSKRLALTQSMNMGR